MSRSRRLLLSLSFGLLVAGLSACSGTTPRVIERDQSLKVVATTTIGSPGWNNPRPSPSPILIMASNGLGAQPAQGSSTRPPSAGSGASSVPDLRSAAEHQRVVVVDGTDGVGAWLRSDPAGDPVRVWPDGSPMLVVGSDREAQGRTWRNVMTIDGGNGWMASDYLAPLDPSLVAAALGPAPVAAAPPPAEANLAAAPATPTPSAPAPTPTRTPAGQAARLPAATATVTATPGPTSANASRATPTPTVAATPSATPIRAANGAHAVKVGDLTLTLKSMVRAMAIQVGNRPRPGMELVGVEIDVMNEGNSAAAIYRSGFRLALADGSRMEPLNGQEPAFAYSVDLPASHELEGWLTFEVPKGAAIDSLQWSPDRAATYAIGPR